MEQQSEPVLSPTQLNATAAVQMIMNGGNTLPVSTPQYLHNRVTSVMLMGVPIIALTIDNQERLCLAQISNTLLKDYSYNEIHNRRVALGITCCQCTPVQLEILRRAGAMPISSRRCGMISLREAERLCKSFLGDNEPLRLPENFAFDVEHRCAWGCEGQFVPSRYNSSRAKCVRCKLCRQFFSPNKFIFHSHRRTDRVYVEPNAANFNSWRRHLFLANADDEDLANAWEDVKAIFNGGTRRRCIMTSASGETLVMKRLEGSTTTSSSPGAEEDTEESKPAQQTAPPKPQNRSAEHMTHIPPFLPSAFYHQYPNLLPGYSIQQPFTPCIPYMPQAPLFPNPFGPMIPYSNLPPQFPHPLSGSTSTLPRNNNNAPTVQEMPLNLIGSTTRTDKSPTGSVNGDIPILERNAVEVDDTPIHDQQSEGNDNQSKSESHCEILDVSKEELKSMLLREIQRRKELETKLKGETVGEEGSQTEHTTSTT